MKCLNIQSFSISIVQLVIALALFLIASLFFKYARIKKADIAKVYNYVPYYWKYLQLMSILILIGLFLTDLLFSNYLNKLNIPPIVKNISLFETSVVIILILIIFWVADKLTITFTLAFQHKVILDSVKSIIIFSTSLDGDVIIYGKGAEDITGYKLEELIQEERLDKIFFDKNKNPINFKSEIKGLLSKSLEWVCVRKDGYPITVLMYIVPQLSLDGKHIGYIFSGVDISDTKKAEAALKRQLIFLQKLIDNIPVAIYYKGSDMRMIGCNKVFEELLEHSKEEIVGASAKDIYYDENAGDVSQKTDVQILKGLSSISYEITLNTKKANPKNIIFYKTAFKTLSGKFRGIIGVLIDVTKERKVRDERDKLQISLMQQNKLASLGELSGSIAHELNNPLTIILGYTQVLMRDKTLNNETAKAIKNIYDAAQRSHNIIKNMLGFARTDSLKVQEIDINNIVEQTLFIVEKDFYKSNIEIVKNLTDQSVFVLVNPMQIQQVILNIMLNAKDAMPDGGKLTITTTVEKDKYMLSLKDTGMGIEKGNIAKVFDPFFTTKEVGKGTGLGLSICYGIIKGLKGKISVESTVGKGTVFYIDFPLKKI
ncbi:MAG: PAS domain-containing protein [Endomicrobium sp.]|nr:PAS domain-containing protein [Endomicrobium sp.]